MQRKPLIFQYGTSVLVFGLALLLTHLLWPLIHGRGVHTNPPNRFERIDISKAIQAGLTFRPLEETVRDTLEWAKMRPMDHEWRAGLTAEREAEVLAELKEK